MSLTYPTPIYPKELTHLARIIRTTATVLDWLRSRLIDLELLIAVTVVQFRAVAGQTALEIGFAVCLGTEEVVVEAGVFGRVVSSGTAPDEVFGGCEEGNEGEDSEKLHDELNVGARGFECEISGGFDECGISGFGSLGLWLRAFYTQASFQACSTTFNSNNEISYDITLFSSYFSRPLIRLPMNESHFGTF